VSLFRTSTNRVFETSVLSTDVSRALRSSLALAAAWALCLLTGHAPAAALAATAAQNIALPDVRGDYGGRLIILLALTLLMAVSAFAGVIAGGNALTATVFVGILALLAGCWRHLSGDYGPQFAVASVLLFFIAASQPGNWHRALQLAELTAVGALGGIVFQLVGWFVRPQHPLRHAVAEAWVAASDLIHSLRSETEEESPHLSDLSEKEANLRATVDRTLTALAAATNHRSREFVTHLDDATQLSARMATRIEAFHTALEPLKARPGFAKVAPTLDSVLRSLSNVARSAALTIITHRPEQFVALQVRMRRAGGLIKVLDSRLAEMDSADSEIVQVRQLLAQVLELIPAIRSTLEKTVDHGAAHAGIGLRIPDLRQMPVKSLSMWLNTAPQLESVLVRYTFRITVLLVVTVAFYKHFAIPHGYWIPFTALVVLQPDYGATRQKAGQRIVGTITGSILASLLLWVKMPVGLLVFCASVMAFLFAYFLRRRYALAVFFVTVMLVLMTESMMEVHLEFTVVRLLSNLAGGILALLAALLFWPKWEQERFPKIFAASLRANRKYLDTITTHIIRGEPFSGDVIQSKREVERANSESVASVQRSLGEPSSRQKNLELAAALATYNQRMTRALTVLGVHLNKRKPFAYSKFELDVRAVGESMESLAKNLESETSHTLMDTPKIEMPPVGNIEAELIYSQLSKVVTELEAMMLEMKTSEDTDESNRR
jgi:uncharacterized membrane protein YccC